MSNKDKHPDSGRLNLNRREFLKGLGAVLAGMMVPKGLGAARRGVSADASPIKHAEVVETPKRWTREKLLTNTSEFLNAAIEKIQELEKTDPSKLTNALRNVRSSFIKTLDTSNPGDTQENLQQRLLFRQEFEKGYKRYGSRVSKIATDLEKIAPEINTQGTPHYPQGMPRLGIWWHSLDILNAVLFDNSLPPESFTYEVFDEFIQLRSWFSHLDDKKSDAEERKLYVNDAKKDASFPKLLREVEETWDDAWRMKMDPEQNGASERRTPARKEVFINLLKTIHEHFPVPFRDLEFIDFTNKPGRRDHYIHGERGIYLGDQFFKAMDAVERFKLSPQKDYFVSVAQREMDLFGWIVLHELGHNINVDVWPYDIPVGIHPSDYLDFFESRIEFISQFENAIVGNEKLKIKPLTLDEIQLWFFDSLSPKRFGIDELSSQNSLSYFLLETDLLKNLDQYLTNLSKEEREKILGATTTGDLFTTTGKWLTQWEVSQNETVIQEPNPEPAGFRKLQDRTDNKYQRITYGSGLSFKALDEMQELAKQLLKDRELPENEKAHIRGTLLSVKSMFLLGAYSFLDQLQNKGMISSKEHPILTELYQTIRDQYIHEHLLHAQLGPYGQYMPDNAFFSILVDAQTQVDSSSASAILDREFIDEKYHLGLSGEKAKGLISYLERANRKLIKVQKSTARYMGLTPAPEITEISAYVNFGYDLIYQLSEEMEYAVGRG